MQTEILNCPTGQFSLVRPGTPKNTSLRAWDAADEYLINYTDSHFSHCPLAIFNDSFGALGVALHQQANIWVSDSFCAKQALEINQQTNQIASSTQIHGPLSLPEDMPNLCLYKIPKNTSFMEYQLSQLAQRSHQQQKPTTVLLSGMMKHLPKTLLDILAKYGEPTRLPFVKKAMLVVLQIGIDKPGSTSPYPTTAKFNGTHIQGHANVFGRSKLDQGTQLLLQHRDKLPEASNVADLCCGTGIIGLHYAQRTPSAHVDFYDESYSAVECVKRGIELNGLTSSYSCFWGDGLASADSQQYELILCNPPFHELHAVSDHIAWRLFKDAKRCLKLGGDFIIVGNRHLGYHTRMKKLFGNVHTIASNAKFVVLRSKVEAK